MSSLSVASDTGRNGCRTELVTAGRLFSDRFTVVFDKSAPGLITDKFASDTFATGKTGWLMAGNWF